MTKKINSLLQTISSFIWHIFLAGLITLLPLALTVALFNLVFKGLVRWLQPLKYFEPASLRQFLMPSLSSPSRLLLRLAC